LQCGHKAIQLVNPDQRQDHLERLTEGGIDPAAMQRSGQLELHINTDVYLPDGRFVPDRIITAFEQLASGNSTAGYPLSRICCRMEWAVNDQSHVDDVIEFESRVNDVWRRHEDAVICTYRLGQFRADEVIDIMRTHPMVIIGGILQQNPFYVPPDEFLQEFRQRRSSRKTSPVAP
jgi:enamine deaminase RidA (YjgF/YER057c/UK114 family)